MEKRITNIVITYRYTFTYPFFAAGRAVEPWDRQEPVLWMKEAWMTAFGKKNLGIQIWSPPAAFLLV